ncbi:hypothetical protein BJX63DRAFT_397925 [Aspergillus granulosus]|uniref:Uncharacterized protein n=1 Tax=Aspergillus granulosus TaxID=176169 RepID=A0ABR4H8S9_9EURO
MVQAAENGEILELSPVAEDRPVGRRVAIELEFLPGKNSRKERVIALMIRIQRDFVHLTKAPMSNFLIPYKRHDNIVCKISVKSTVEESWSREFPLPLVEVAGLVLGQSDILSQNFMSERKLFVLQLIGFDELRHSSLKAENHKDPEYLLPLLRNPQHNLFPLIRGRFHQHLTNQIIGRNLKEQRLGNIPVA